jgi:superfamily II DNA helicase RecQ
VLRDQVVALQQKGIAVGCLGADTTPEELANISNGKYNLLFGTPESILRSYRNVFRDDLKDKIDVIFVDESHCVAKWLVCKLVSLYVYLLSTCI